MSMPDAFRKLQLSDIPDVIEAVLARKQAEDPLAAFATRPPNEAHEAPERGKTLLQPGYLSEKTPPTPPPLPATGRGGQGVRACRSLTTAGHPCRATPRSESGLCIYHDPDYAEQHRLNSHNGGVASGNARQRLPLVDPETINLADRTSLQALIDAVLRLELSGKLPPDRSRVIVRLLSLAVRNFDRPARDSYYDAVIAAHDAETYATHREALDTQLLDMIDQLDMDETLRRTRAIADVGSKRQEYLRANEMFAPPPPPILKPHEVEWPNDHMLDDADD